MSTSKHMDRICILAVAAALLISALFSGGAALIPARATAMGYADRLFDTSRVHTIDIRIDDWDGFLSTAQSEEYSLCDVVIDGEPFANVGIRGKGNTSLSTVSSMDSDRYSFKLEFDQYNTGGSYYGLDKLSLNNLIQDNTMMKDYLTYEMMRQFGAAAPLCSYVYITVNGEDWGLYLAVEAVEESFLLRNYGTDYGDLYKPDSMNMGGGRGNGKDFSFEEFMGDSATDTRPEDTMPTMPEGFDPAQMGGTVPSMPENFDFAEIAGGFGMGASDAKLQYMNDDPESYSTIFDSAKTDVTAADQRRLIASLKTLSQGENPEAAVDVDAVICYFVVHNYVVNADSYTGSMIHNYYLYEEDGLLSMIPWDYNLAFGTFQGGDASQMVSDAIDSPLSVTGSDRPMIDWIFASEEYTELYHAYFREFLDAVDMASIIAQAQALIEPYVEKDPTKFCTFEEFEKGVETLTAFCALRSQSIADQLAGGDGTVDASAITLSDMGTMGGGFGGGRMPGQGGMQMSGQFGSVTPDGSQSFPRTDNQGGMTLPEGMEMPEDMENMQPGQRGDSQGNFPSRGQSASQGSFPGQTSPTQSESPWLLLGITALFLAAGLLFAFQFKR